MLTSNKGQFAFTERLPKHFTTDCCGFVIVAQQTSIKMTGLYSITRVSSKEMQVNKLILQ